MRTVAASKLGQYALICVQCNLITLQVMKMRMSLILMKTIKRTKGFIVYNLTIKRTKGFIIYNLTFLLLVASCLTL